MADKTKADKEVVTVTIHGEKEAEAPQDQPQTHIIDPAGDVILAVGSPVAIRLCVSSVLLRRTSNVFAALFSPRFREGSELAASTEPQEVALPEDDADAVFGMCQLLHGQDAEGYPGIPSATRIFTLACTIDKYDCVKPLRLPVTGLLMMYLDKPDGALAKDMGQILPAAYMLNHRRAFFIASQRLIQAWNGRFATDLDPEVLARIPQNVLFAIDDKRAAARDCIVTELLPILRKKCSTGCNVYLPPHLENLTIPMVITISGISPWPPQFGPGSLQTIAGIITTLENRPNQDLQSYCGHQKPVHLPGAAFGGLVGKLRNLSGGLCLDCAIEGKQDLTDGCRTREHQESMQ